MARDLPDWGALTAQATVHEVTDLGELAVRLGSIVSFDRRGDVIWLDEFECGLGKWYTEVGGADGSIALSTDRARNGETSVLLTTDSDSDGYATIIHSNPIPVLSKIGYEQSFSLGLHVKKLEMRIVADDGANKKYYAIYWDEVAETLSYLDENDAPVVFASGVSLYAAGTMFHTAKLVVDMVSNKYVRFILDSTSYSMADKLGYEGSTANTVQVTVEVVAWGRSGDNDTVYVDDVILTQNEPAEP